MLYQKVGFGSYGPRFHEQSQEHVAGIWSIGWEERTSKEYRWDGMQRDEQGIYILQYTLSGKGMIEIDGKSISLEPGQAFFIDVPSEHCYFLPGNSERWEFLYITLYGDEAAKCWEYIRRTCGTVVTIPIEAKIIQCLIELYKQVAEKKLLDAYSASAKAYECVMECYRFAKQMDNLDRGVSSDVSKALYYMQMHYQQPIVIEDIANAANLSKYYFINKFREQMSITPMQYLTKIRIERAVQLLRQTNFPIGEIAAKTGYANANYFNKVFKRIVGVSAGRFREGKGTLPIDHIIIQ